MTLEQENALLSIRALLDHWAALPAATRMLQPHLLALLEECEPRLDMRSLHQLGQGFVLSVRVPAGDDPEEYCAAVEAFFDYPRLTVQPYEVPKFPMPSDGSSSDEDLSKFGARTRYIYDSAGSGKWKAGKAARW